MSKATNFLLLLLLAACGMVQAQTGNGSIQGTVKDASGAVVPGAAVTITQTETSVKFDTKSNGVGLFVFPSVSAGPYTILVEASGMRSWEAKVTLLTGQTIEVNPALVVGLATQTVTVSSDITPLVNTTSGTLDSVLERERVEQLPLNGRYFTSLLTTIPGLEGGNSGGTSFVNGVRYGIEMQMDGALMSNRYTGNTFARPPGLDSINQVQATTNAASAKVSRPGLVTISTRSGTNQIHGSFFETAKNNGVGLARSRTDYYTTAPHLVRNEFGGSVGGPIWVPKVYNGKNKTFFFFNYETRRNMSASTMSTAVETPAMRQGNFGGLTDSLGHAITLYDPYSSGPAPTYARNPYPGNQIPITQESPVAKFVFQNTPLPTLPNVNPLVSRNWFGPGPSASREYTYTMRFDHHFTDQDQMFVRYSRGKRSSLTNGNGGYPGTLDGLSNMSDTAERNNTAVVSYTHSFSPTFFSETNLNYLHEYFGTPQITDQNISQQLGLPDPAASPGLGWPRIYPDGSSTSLGMAYNGYSFETMLTRIATLDQNFTLIRGRHELLFGVRLKQEALGYGGGVQLPAGQVFFNSNATALYDSRTGSAFSAVPYTGNNWANMFLGIASNYGSQFWRNAFKEAAAERSIYFQDNFKVTSRLTVNAGLRWEYFQPFQVADGGVIGWDPKTMAIVLGTSSTDQFIKQGDSIPALIDGLEREGMTFESYKQAGLPSSLVYNYYKNFGARMGFAYQLIGGVHPMVVRGGAALYAYPEALGSFVTDAEYSMPGTGNFYLQQNTANQSPDGLANYLLRKAPTIVAGVNSANAIDMSVSNALNILTPGSQNFRVADPNQPTDRAWNWNFTLEKAIGLSTMVSAAYVGSHGYNLSQFIQYNDPPASAYVWYTETGQPTPTGTYSNVAQRPYFSPTGPGSVYGKIEVMQKTGWSNMNGIQLQAQHRFSNGIGFQVFYSLSNAMRAGGFGWNDHLLENPQYYLPGAVPTDLHARDKLVNYARSTEIPKHRINYNWLYNLPVGRGRKFGSHLNRALDLALGGWQLAGSGSVTSSYFTLPTSNWGSFGQVQVYGTQYPIQDCRSGTCYRGYLWWNGYIPSTQIGAYDSAGNCAKGKVCGIPSNYTPSNTPIVTDPTSQYYNTNTVFITLKNGQTVGTTVNTGLNPWQKQYAPGPWVYGLDSSLWKAFQIREQVSLKLHADFFNVLNMPGLPAPSSDGTLSLQTSRSSPRSLQLSLQLVW